MSDSFEESFVSPQIQTIFSSHFSLGPQRIKFGSGFVSHLVRFCSFLFGIHSSIWEWMRAHRSSSLMWSPRAQVIPLWLVLPGPERDTHLSMESHQSLVEHRTPEWPQHITPYKVPENPQRSTLGISEMVLGTIILALPMVFSMDFGGPAHWSRVNLLFCIHT